MPKKTENQIEPTVLSPTGGKLGRLDRDAVRATQRLTDRGFEAYLVGGCVRDMLLDRDPKDFDIATSARPQQVKRTFPRNCRIIGRRFKLAHLHFDRNTKILEVSTFRRTPEADGSDDDLLITRDNEFGTAEEDALRRDFTVNALFLDPTRDRILDWCNGLQDLKDRVIRTIGDPVVRFREDPVRILRAAKFAGRLGFSIDPETFAAMAETAGDLVRAAPPRVLEEILRLLRGGHALASFQLLRDIGALKSLVPVAADFLGTADRNQRDAFWGLLDALDQRVHDGHVPSNAVLLGVLHVGPVLARAAAEPDRSPSSIAEELLGPLSQALKLPRRDAGCLKRICGVQHRFEAAAGKKRFRVSGFVRGPYFPEAIELLGLRVAAGDVDREALDRWHELATEHGFDPEAEAELPPPPARTSRSKRTRRPDREDQTERDEPTGREERAGTKPSRKRSKKAAEPAAETEDPMPEPADADDPRESDAKAATDEHQADEHAASAPKPKKRRRTKKKAAPAATADEPSPEDDASDVIFGAAPAKTSVKPAQRKARKTKPVAEEDGRIADDRTVDDRTVDDRDGKERAREEWAREERIHEDSDDADRGNANRDETDRLETDRDHDRAEPTDARADDDHDDDRELNDRDRGADDESEQDTDSGDRPRRRRRRRRRRSRADEDDADTDESRAHDEDRDERDDHEEDASSERGSDDAADDEDRDGDDEDRPRRRRRRRRGRGKKARATDDDEPSDRRDRDDAEDAPDDEPHEDSRDTSTARSRKKKAQKKTQKKAPRKTRSRKSSEGGDGKKKRRERRRGGGRDVDVVPRSRDRRGKVEVIEPPAMDLSAFDVELDPKRVPTFGTIVEGKGRPKRRTPRVREDGQDDYKPPPPPGPGGDAPPPPTPNKPDDPDTFGDW